MTDDKLDRAMGWAVVCLAFSAVALVGLVLLGVVASLFYGG